MTYHSHIFQSLWLCNACLCEMLRIRKFGTHAAVQQCASSSSTSLPHSSGSGCASSYFLGSRSPWKCPGEMEEQRLAGLASPGESYRDKTQNNNTFANLECDLASDLLGNYKLKVDDNPECFLCISPELSHDFVCMMQEIS